MLSVRSVLRSCVVGVAVVAASATALTVAPPAFAGIDGEPTHSVGLGSQATFRHQGDYLYVTDLKADGQCAVGVFSPYTGPDLPRFSPDVEVVVNCKGKGATVRKSFESIPEGRIIHYYACTTRNDGFHDYCGAQMWAQA